MTTGNTIAERIAADSEDEAAFIRQAFAVVLGISAGEAEIGASSQAIKQWRELPGGSADRARAHLIWALIFR